MHHPPRAAQNNQAYYHSQQCITCLLCSPPITCRTSFVFGEKKGQERNERNVDGNFMSHAMTSSWTCDVKYAHNYASNNSIERAFCQFLINLLDWSIFNTQRNCELVLLSFFAEITFEILKMWWLNTTPVIEVLYRYHNRFHRINYVNWYLAWITVWWFQALKGCVILVVKRDTCCKYMS